jgi:hypothetical protein
LKKLFGTASSTPIKGTGSKPTSIIVKQDVEDFSVGDFDESYSSSSPLKSPGSDTQS